jgi:hypothetical protein
MIIGVNGYIGSGKDTVGSIIQSLFAKDYGVYKTQFDFIQGGNWIKEQQSGWQIKKFAGKLKQIASLLTGIPVEKFEDQEFKKTNLGPEWDVLVRAAGKRQDGLFGNGKMEIKKMTVREFLQKLGTDAVRDGLHVNTWVNALMCDYNPKGFKYKGVDKEEIKGEWEYPNWIITDTRFPNEAKAIKDKGGIVIRVVRGEASPTVHVSETALDSWDFDHVIYNNGTIEELIKKVQICLQQEQLL